jgi:hypothetical protein
MICVALVAAAGGAVWPVAVYVAVVALTSVLATVFASLRPDVAAPDRGLQGTVQTQNYTSPRWR